MDRTLCTGLSKAPDPPSRPRTQRNGERANETGQLVRSLTLLSARRFSSQVQDQGRDWERRAVWGGRPVLSESRSVIAG